MVCFPARDRVGALFLLRPDLDVGFAAGHKTPVFRGIGLGAVTAREGAADNVGQLQQVVAVRILHFDFADLSDGEARVIDPPPEVGGELFAEIAAAAAVDDDNGIAKMMLGVFENQTAGVFVK